MIRRLWLRLPARSRPRWLAPIVAWIVAWLGPGAALVSAPAPLPVAAELRAGALVVAWQPPPGQALACVFATTPDRLLGCTLGGAGTWTRGPGSVDASLRVGQGDTLEVRAWDVRAAPRAHGTAGVRGAALWLPSVSFASGQAFSITGYTLTAPNA